ncbi:phosphoglycerate mutase (2,3-diphosphoglycerate-independent) [candidate division WOR-1 bacterium RIFOXYD2_FULL_41_8]|uniref:2,3-bisphosphoglycerate-independent phosphoglycerate mutase n=1 Tax=Candidatus Uhrbacteria bacterium RIFOXYC2_FULL_47_19 TaxID=1802424 RepID=A0A1F7WE94_9BACT|nr:MAG: phosphoglycerate mutase (2,3-diphosphoglycerate-independent) [candidate division WOR-1 bacterium RIFOXYD2_FULL_41_8]OGM01142.1 MAG: phosphoglycerate mutase (2,3-diphosphoglycerate-independent) [Candidatus Uhrbacteria bacterium RIFOXYC2_FULL_47_19]
MADNRPKPVVLLILDGWGVAQSGPGNPIEAATTPYLDEIVSSFPTMTVLASGEAVGLSWGEMGNSEVGHFTIGAGRIFYQTFPRINLSIQNGGFFENEVLLAAAEHVKKSRKTLHIMGILSPGNVHGSDAHIHALLEFAKRQELSNVVVHVFTDGRDTKFNSSVDFIRQLQDKISELGVGRIGSISGRFYAMDRDNRWDRVEKAYNVIVGQSTGNTCNDPVKALEDSYAAEVYDEEFVPTVVVGSDGQPVGPVKDGDAIIFANFRPDRARQITTAFVDPSFSKFDRQQVSELFFGTMAEYEKDLPVRVVFPPEMIDVCLAQVISAAGLKQLHIAETEKYAHVTFFLNGKREEEFPGETRVIIPSPRVSSYDQAPEMSTIKITERILQEIEKGEFDVIISNFANADMVGHTGNFEATKLGCETIDQCVGRIVNTVLPRGGVVVITADHGNGEEVLNLQTGEMDKEHSTNPVPFIVIGEHWRGQAAPGGGEGIGGDLSLMTPVGMLADTAPTILKLLGIEKPEGMTGSPLI